MRPVSKHPEPLRVFGAGVRAQLIADLIDWQFADVFRIEGYYDDHPPADGTGPGGFPIFGTFADGVRDMPRLDRRAIIATGTRSSVRGCRVLAELRAHTVPIASLISPAALVSPSAVFGDNAVVFPGVFIGANVRIGDLFCAHGGAVVEHHSELGHNVMMGPRGALSGFVNVASHCFLGAGCAVHPERLIGRGSMIGAGSVVVRDIPPHVIARGAPAAVARPVRPGDDVPTPDEVLALSQIGFN
jgi:sugar O-acyltransferase (sialic acid O-acetyltransferase NeuD family)